MSSADKKRWIQAWRKELTCDFHQTAVNKVLIEAWPFVKLEGIQSVFAPLCGKSLDMLWLVEQGFQVVGVEISPIAVKAFFDENGLHPRKSEMGAFTKWQAGAIVIFCGDFFKLKRAQVGAIDYIYDRASLTALSPAQRQPYMRKVKKLCNVPMLLLTLEEQLETAEIEDRKSIDVEVQELYGRDHHIQVSRSTKVGDIDKGNVLLHKAYIITPTSVS